mmetsp:Transcript_28156/g.68953  ORF Transcript_28156/g.68953 Transcript_28156/m.68953 type:complete len:147 (-) Transcript_28156:1336-1776(-)
MQVIWYMYFGMLICVVSTMVWMDKRAVMRGQGTGDPSCRAQEHRALGEEMEGRARLRMGDMTALPDVPSSLGAVGLCTAHARAPCTFRVVCNVERAPYARTSEGAPRVDFGKHSAAVRWEADTGAVWAVLRRCHRGDKDGSDFSMG